jgi:NAD(P)-dependent dehydrogenase (short-subunit alcohol dehydrogenase family)
MQLTDKVAVVTGGGSGIGRAMSRRFAAEGAAAVVVADLGAASAHETAAQITGAGGTALAVGCDVAREADVIALVAQATETFGRVDLFCSNAGIGNGGGVEASNEDWQRSWEVNLMAHVYAARAVLPQMLARGDGYLLTTASAAGLLTNLGAAPYTVTKHAAVALAEWLAITHGDAGIKVSCLCPQGVRTPMLLGGLDQTAGAVVAAGGDLLEPDQVAEAVVAGLAEEQFLILPHPEVGTYLQHKASDPDRWLRGMRKLQARVIASLPGYSAP